MKYFLITCLLLCFFLANAQMKPKVTPKKETQKMVAKPTEIKQTNPTANKGDKTSKDSVNIPNQPTKIDVSVMATLTRESFSVNNGKLPQWKVELVITNEGTLPVELGESMVLLAGIPNKDAYLALNILRNRKKERDDTKRLYARYGINWGVDVPATGSAIWNLGAFIGDRLSSTDRFMLLLTSPWISADSNSGFGLPIPPRSKRTITETIPFPFDIEIQGTRNQLILIPPSFEGMDKSKTIISHSAIIFDVKGDVQVGTVVRPASIKLWDNSTTDLQSVEEDKTKPLWLRMFSLNWLAEARHENASKILLENASSDQVPELLRLSSLTNLGLWKVPGSLNILTKTLQETTSDDMKVAALRGLSELADPASAPFVREYVNSKEDRIAYAAIEASGKNKDTAAIALITSQLNSRRELLYAVTASSLMEIGTESARSALIETAKSKKAEFSARRESMLAIGKLKLAEVVPVLENIASDESEQDGIRMNAITALASMENKQAYISLRKPAASKKESIRNDAMEELAKSKDEESINFLIGIAGKEGTAQAGAIAALGKAKVKTAVPLFRSVLQQEGTNQKVRLAAISAVAEMKIIEAKPELITSLTDVDEDVYSKALGSLKEMFGAEMIPHAMTALKSKFKSIRKIAAETLSSLDTIAPKSQNDLWAAYQKEKDKWTGYAISSALIKLKWKDNTAVASLVDGLDEKKNDLWFENIRLLRHLTGQVFGPESEYVGKKEQQAEITKWKDWWATQPK